MIGKGTFSKVYRAKLTKDSSKEYALKCIVPTIKWDKIADELRYLRDLGGDSNIIGVQACFLGGGYTIIVMPYFRHDQFIDIIKVMTGPEVKEYMRNLFIALAKVHKAGVIHRDVKPSNFLFNRKLQLYGLVDFGLAQEAQALLKQAKLRQAQIDSMDSTKTKRKVLKDLTKTNSNHLVIANKSAAPVMVKKRSFDAMNDNQTDGPNKKKRVNSHNDQRNVPETPPKNSNKVSRLPRLPMKSFTRPSPCDCFEKPQVCENCLARQELCAPRAGTPGFRAPEVLLKYLWQTSAIDIWSAGVIMISLVSRRYPFFRNNDDVTSLGEMITLLGSDRMADAAQRLKRTITIFPKHRPPLNLKLLCERLRGNNQMTIEDTAYDLVDKLLEPNPYKRISAADALNHPFFHSEPYC